MHSSTSARKKSMKVLSFTRVTFLAITALLLIGPSYPAASINLAKGGNIDELRDKLNKLMSMGKYLDIVNELKRMEDLHGTLALDDGRPTFYTFLGIAYHGLKRNDDAEKAFQTDVKYAPSEMRSWINLGEIQTLNLKFNLSLLSYQKAYEVGGEYVLPRLLSAKAWCASWKNWESIAYFLEKTFIHCAKQKKCSEVESGLGMEYTDTPERIGKLFLSLAPFAQSSNFRIPQNKLAPLWRNYTADYTNRDKTIQLKTQRKKKNKQRRLKVGIISSDFGVHPVSSLIRGVVEYMDKKKIELFCFSVTSATSFWGEKIKQFADHFIVLTNVNTQDAALTIASYGIEILVDLNGHTKNTGLTYMSHYPAPVQMSYLGLPTTTAASFIDYYIGDYVSLPPENRDHFKESLALMQPCYIANDYAQLQGDVVTHFSGHRRAPKEVLETDVDISDTTTRFLFSTISNPQKFNPEIYETWMNILRQLPGSKLLLTDHTHILEPLHNLRQVARALGVHSNRIGNLPVVPWIDHIYRKTSIDMFLDTVAKNGHTTGLDGIWAGVPTVSLGGGSSMPKRAAESIASALGSEIGISYSLKEYEDIVFKHASDFLSNPASNLDRDIEVAKSGAFDRLALWREHVESLRTKSSLFDTRLYTKSFEHLLQAVWEVTHIAAESAALSIGGHEATKNSSFSLFHKIKKPNQQESRSEKRRNRKRQRENGVGGDLVIGHRKKYHVFATVRTKEDVLHRKMSGLEIPLHQVYDQMSDHFKGPPNEAKANIIDRQQAKGGPLEATGGDNLNTESDKVDPLYPPLPEEVLQSKVILLNIGGMNKKVGWFNVNPVMQPYAHTKSHTDIIRPMHDLKGFPNNSVTILYASHVLTRGSNGADSIFHKTLAEWQRVLRPDGLLMISVPDLRTLGRMYLDQQLSLQERWTVTLMIYGAQSNELDYHLVGLDESMLTHFLQDRNFCDIERVGSMRLHHDASDLVFHGYKVSLNMIARKCKNADVIDGVIPTHPAEPYDRERDNMNY